MTQGWVNLGQKQRQLAQIEKHYRERGYSDGYALKVAASLNATYQVGWRKGRAARRAFDAGEGTA